MGFRHFIPVVLTAGIILVSPNHARTQQQPMFRSGTELVDLFVTVTNDDGRLVPNLTREDFEVYDDNELQELVVFDGARYVRTRPDRNLRRFAEETGGGYFELTEADELGPTFTRVAQELHSQYVIGFTPSEPDGKLHNLEVRLKNQSMTARARRSYIAPLASSPERDAAPDAR